MFVGASTRSPVARWFFDWQGLLTVVVTVALVAVTGFYVWLTRGLRDASVTATELAAEALRQNADALAVAREALEQGRDSVALTRAALDHDRERWQVDLAERERSQAQFVGCTFEGKRVIASDETLSWLVHNNSPAAIYEVRSFILFQGVPHRDGSPKGMFIGAGQERQMSQEGTFNVDNLSLDHIGVTFRDNWGRWWIKWASGHLRRLGADPEMDLRVPGSTSDPTGDQ